MSIDISRKNEDRLKAAATSQGLSVDAWIERMMGEREELAAIVERAAARSTPLSRDEIRAKIERGFLQSEQGDVVDGETFWAGLLDELDDLERKRRAG